MKSIYTTYLNTWRNNGGELLFLLGYVQRHGRHGYWGMLERQDQPLNEAPKFAAALQFIAKQPAWWNEPWPVKSAKAPSPPAEKTADQPAAAKKAAGPTEPARPTPAAKQEVKQEAK
ncbi:MAG: hypothetical protein H7X95_00130 [Deltaproteobacteria bacterium]|nr:hypothetical protein [Deltaproteobacteria bacterium]